jgi:histidine triad (HIT) family protein
VEDSIFTKIIKGEIPCYKVYEDDYVIAFLDIHPKQPGHTLVIPKQQIDLLWDLDDETYDYLWATTKKIARNMTEVLQRRIGVQVEGIGVPHAHIHLIPFDTADEFLSKQDLSAEPDHTALTAMAERLAF